MGQGYRERFESMAEELRSNRNVRVIKLALGRPAARAEIASAERRAGGALPDGVERFYREMNGFSLEWEHTVESIRSHDSSDRGFVELLPIGRVFASWRGQTWFADIEGGETYRPVKPFDRFQPEACAAFYQPPGKAPEDRVYYHYFGEILEATGYTFPEYVDRLLASRGFFYWIVTLCAGLQSTREATSFREKMPLISDDFEAALFPPARPV